MLLTNDQIVLDIEDAFDLANEFDLVVDICDYSKEISISKEGVGFSVEISFGWDRDFNTRKAIVQFLSNYMETK